MATVYRIPESGVKARAWGAGKKVLLLAVLIAAAAGFGIANGGGGSEEVATAIAFIVVVFGTMVSFSMWRVRRLLAGYELHVGGDGLLRRQGRNDVQIGWDEIGRVEQNRNGALVVTSADRKRTIGVLPEVERYQEVRAEIARRASAES